MAFEYGFYNSIGGDRKYNAIQFGQIFDGIINDGVFLSIGEKFATLVTSGMEITVGTGKAWFNHTWNLNTTRIPITLSASHPVLARYDVVVLEVNDSPDVSGRVNTIKLIEGTPSSNPVKPTLINSEYIHQYPLSYIKINPGVTSLTAADIEIMVGQDPCPYVTGILRTTDISELFNNWESQFTIWFDNLKAQLTDDIVTNLQNQIDNCLKKTDIATPEDIENATTGKVIDASVFSPYVHKIGDIVYSATRNIEEDTNGIWIACDQRTIDMGAYPDLPRNALYWPYPELVFTDETMKDNENITPQDYVACGNDANTPEWIYINRNVASIAYSLVEKRVYPGVGAYGLFRVAADKVLAIYNDAKYYNNDLTAHSDAVPSAISSVLGSGAIQRIGESSFFVMSFATSGSYTTGFYKTTDGFQTLQLIPPTESTTSITSAMFDKGAPNLKSKKYTKSPLYPIKKTDDGEMVVFLSSATTSQTSRPSTEAERKKMIKSMLPVVWKTSGGISSITKSVVGGDDLVAAIADLWAQSALNFRYIVSIDCKFCAFSVQSGSNYYICAVNLETMNFTITPADSQSWPVATGLNNVLYNKYKHQIIAIATPKDIENASSATVINTDDLSVQINVRGAEQNGGPGSIPINYMDSVTAVACDSSTLSPRIDKRLHDRGISVKSKTAASLIGQGIDGFADFMAMDMGGPFAAYGFLSSPNRESQFIPFFKNNITGATNMTEYDGDIYWPRGASLYKIPKNKRQMPYIKNAFMKVLN